jgi:hypothetical protein
MCRPGYYQTGALRNVTCIPTFPAEPMPAPYRDENETLRRENARLKGELAKRARGRLAVALLLLGADFLAVTALRPWLNGGSDLKFWSALIVVVGIAGAAVACAFGREASGRREP